MNTPEDKQPSASKKTEALIEKLLAQIGEHCTSVRIICVLPDDDSDDHYIFTKGVGDWHSQRGAVREWMLVEDQKTKKQAEGDE